jgi:type III pantothenate kinase
MMKQVSADFLLVDVSNSFTKLAFASRARVGRTMRISTAELSTRRLNQILRTGGARTIVACSVVPKKNREIEQAAGNRRIIWLTPKVRLNVRIDYPNPSSIGPDRLANAVAVTELYGPPAVVIDFGTAVTFDIVSADRGYIGGVIAPGLEAMTKFLYDRTALLPRISLREPRRAVGKSTYQAMLAGAIFGYRGLVREILGRIVREQFPKKRLHVVATGGYARLIARQLPEVGAVHENLTLEGLRLVGCMNERP